MRLLVPLTDAFGGRGGIAQFNRDLLRALCVHPDVERVTAMPRVMPDAPGEYPRALDYRTEAVGGKGAYLEAMARHVWRGAYDGVICGHIHLLPIAWLAARRAGVPLLLIVHGIEARDPSDKWLANQLVPGVDALVSVSEHTKQQVVRWAEVDPEKGYVVPNCIDRSRFGPGEVPAYLKDRYRLHDRTVMLTLGRLPVQEKRKGHDEVLEALPDLAAEVPDLTYLVCGDGADRARLEAKAERLGVADRTIFAGYIPEEEKADHYRAADVFAMPGRTEGFGIVYLEAMACGVPVVASSADASREAVRNGKLGTVVDPDELEDVKVGILSALREPRGVPDGLDYFSVERFRERWHGVVDVCFGEQASTMVAGAKTEVEHEVR
ncbi:glycosyltransferase family 4 protein [Salinibacter ruber]|uniref:glycosyltransferase family 4 protein n=1 Tax=Salinibacter ruber TaxID=146919 RepID=UPI002168BD20|nr:glycosyltransferase involved in cell wall biosynthesis [Salinibacter ruber]